MPSKQTGHFCKVCGLSVSSLSNAPPPRALLDYMYLQQLNKHLHFSSTGEEQASGLQHISIM